MQENINIPDSTITTNLSFRQLILMNMQQLTNFPYIEKDFDALTDYELLCLVVKFLNDVIDNQNEQNASITRMYESFLALQDYVNNTKDTLEDAFNALDDYVRNYFENLDVQEEINNKLDDMVEQGTLQEIIADYLNSKAIFGFDNVQSLKNATNLIDGSYASTLGYHSKNDGGSALYKIRTITNDDVVDEMFILEMLNDDSLIAELITNEINANQIGAYGNGTNEDTSKIQSLITYCQNNNKILNLVSGKTYLVDTLSITNKLSINGNMATLKPKTTHNILNIDYEENVPTGFIKDLIIDMDYKAPIGINIINDHRRTYENITFNNSATDGIALYVGNNGSPAGCNFINLKGYGNKFQSSQFCKIDGADTVFSNIDYECYKYGIEVNANAMFTNIHGFILGSDIYENSYFMKINASVQAQGLYPDTQHRMFIINATYDGSLSGITTWFNTGTVDYTQFSTPYIFYLTTGPGQLSRTNISNSTFKLPANEDIYKFCNYNNLPLWGTGNEFRNTPYSFPSLAQDFEVNTAQFTSHIKAAIDNGNACISGYVTVNTTDNTQAVILTLKGHRGTFNDQRIACPYWTSGADNNTPSGFITVLASKTNRTLTLYRNSNMQNSNIYINIPISSIFID